MTSRLHELSARGVSVWIDSLSREMLETGELAGAGVVDPKELFWALAVDDVLAACDLLRPVWEEAAGGDGFASLEVDPTLAYDRERTYEEAMRLHGLVERGNLLVKIPATRPGLGAIEDCVAKGRSINVTLIFSLERYAAVAEAYVRGLERLL